jgi:hypothetical protein
MCGIVGHYAAARDVDIMHFRSVRVLLVCFNRFGLGCNTDTVFDSFLVDRARVTLD